LAIADIRLTENKGRSLAESAYQSIRNAILAGHLAVGESVPEEAIAQHLRMSRTPIREAIGRLRTEGLLEEVRPRGHVVSGVGARDVFEVYEIREELEGLCHRLAASRITPHQLFILSTVIDRMEAALDDPSRFSELNREFHAVVVEAAGNPVLAKIMDELMAFVDRFPVSAYVVEGRSRIALDEHRRIVRALELGDKVEAEQAAQDHLRAGLQARLVALKARS
jgi:DNA-binding GntR family transcriptional regulator